MGSRTAFEQRDLQRQDARREVLVDATHARPTRPSPSLWLGRETTAYALAWTFYLLARKARGAGPRVKTRQDKKGEADALGPEGAPSSFLSFS
jgi:hypothetical protein